MDVTNEITIGEEQFTDESWDEFLALPMSDVLVEYTDGGFPQQSPVGFDDRYKLALTFVKLLTAVAVLVGGAILISALRQPDEVTTGLAAGAVTATSPVVCDPIDLRFGIPIPERISCDGGELVATGDLDGAWNGHLSGWDVPDGMIVGGLWQNWDDGTPEPSGFVEWIGRDSHSDTDPADNRYQEIRVTRLAPGDFSIYETRGLTGRSVTFTFVPTGDTPAASAPSADGPQFELTDGRPIAVQHPDGTSIVWSGELSDDDITVAWDPPGEEDPRCRCSLHRCSPRTVPSAQFAEPCASRLATTERSWTPRVACSSASTSGPSLASPEARARSSDSSTARWGRS